MKVNKAMKSLNIAGLLNDNIPLHPKVEVMVESALKCLHKRKGTSYFAIKKYIAENYNVNMNKITPFVKRHIKRAVNKGDVRQLKGRGVVGRFKLIKSVAIRRVKKSSRGKTRSKKYVNGNTPKSLICPMKKNESKKEIPENENKKK